MPQINDIRELAQQNARYVSNSPQDWMSYLDVAARLYRYSFTDTLLIHAQRPDATACAEMELWNQKMSRWVNRGAKGIALLDDTGPRTRLRYVFDIADTHLVRGGRTPLLSDNGALVGVAICGRPVARRLDDGYTLEVNRLCTNGTPNACSILYAAAYRAARAMGYNKVVTYILDTENGSSLKAAGYTCEGRAGGLEWNGAKAPKQADQYPRQMKTRWVKKKEGLHGS